MSRKGLRRLIQNDDVAGVQPSVASKFRHMISFLQDMEREEELHAVPGWRAHRLTGNRRGTWSLFVTANWRLTFRIDFERKEVMDLNIEDCH